MMLNAGATARPQIGTALIKCFASLARHLPVGAEANDIRHCPRRFVRYRQACNRLRKPWPMHGLILSKARNEVDIMTVRNSAGSNASGPFEKAAMMKSFWVLYMFGFASLIGGCISAQAAETVALKSGESRAALR